MTDIATVIPLKSHNKYAKPRHPTVFDSSNPEYIRAKAESTARRTKWQADNSDFAATLYEAIKAVNASELSPELQALSSAIREHGPAIALALIGKLCPQLDIQINHNQGLPQTLRVLGY